MKNWYYSPTMVKFIDDDNQSCYGIGYQDKIICSCCGSIFESKEVKVIDVLPWFNIKNFIEKREEESGLK